MKKSPHPEEEYFAKLDLERLKKLSLKLKEELAHEELVRLRELHHGHCSGCGFKLAHVMFKGYPIYRCFHCDGMFLEKKTLEALSGKESHLFDRIVEIFKF